MSRRKQQIQPYTVRGMEVINISSGDETTDEEDPDDIEIPGGGMNLQQVIEKSSFPSRKSGSSSDGIHNPTSSTLKLEDSPTVGILDASTVKLEDASSPGMHDATTLKLEDTSPVGIHDASTLKLEDSSPSGMYDGSPLGTYLASTVGTNHGSTFRRHDGTTVGFHDASTDEEMDGPSQDVVSNASKEVPTVEVKAEQAKVQDSMPVKKQKQGIGYLSEGAQHLNHVNSMEPGSGMLGQPNPIPETLNPFQTAASNFLSSLGGNPFASLFSGSSSSLSSSYPGSTPAPFDDNSNPNLNPYNMQPNNLFPPSFMGNQLPFDFNRFLANPAIESLYRAILGDVTAPYNPYPADNFRNGAAGPYRSTRVPPMRRAMPKQTVPELWQNANIRRNQIVIPAGNPAGEEQEEDQEEDEEMVAAETYADYKPAKLNIGKRHPDPVIETASMASVLPPDIIMELCLPDKVIKTGNLSALQIEAVAYANRQHDFDLRSGVRSGYLIGDGAGVGKGRTIAGIIYENWLKGRKRSLWISVSADLKFDAERDLSDIGAHMIEVHPLNKQKYGKITYSNGVIFATYTALIGESSQAVGKCNTRLKQLVQWCGPDFNGVIVFDECHRAKNLCPTGSSKPTKTGKTVHEIQELLPRARVVYASATGASEPKNMAYMTRLGIWGPGTPFEDFQAFIVAVEKRGVGAMEIVAMDMKLRGAYIARQLSFQGVTFTIEEVKLSQKEINVYDESVALWVECMQKFIEGIELACLEKRRRKAIWAQFWAAHQRFFKYLCIGAKVKRAVQIARDAVKDGKCVVIGLQSTGEARTLDQLERDEGELTDFVSTAKGVIQALVEKHFPGPIPYQSRRISELVSRKGTSSMFNAFMQEMEESTNGGASSSSGGKRKPMRKAAQKASKRVKFDDSESDDEFNNGDSDFEADTAESSPASSNSSEYEMSDEDVTTEDETDPDEDKPRNEKRKKKNGKKGRRPKKPIKHDKNDRHKPSKEAKQIVSEMKKKLLDKIEKLGEHLPPNTLDELIDQLGGTSEVAEMTGRKGRVIQDDQGNVSYEARTEAEVNLECINLAEKERFMKGEKFIAIISEAASSGISLQSDRRVPNQRRRVHITLELPWSADRAIQQFGRTHRSNQVNAPEYVFLISDLAGEHRFASIVAKRLESLGALTHGDRRATESRDLSRFHIDNKYGRMALESVMRGIIKMCAPMIPPPADYDGDFFADMAGALVGVGLIVNSEEARGIPELEKDYNNMSKFLNRILGMPVKLQNYLFKYFTDTLNFVIKQAKRNGRFDLGIVDLSDLGSNKILRLRKDTYERQHATGIGAIELHELQVERGLTWEEAIAKFETVSNKVEGFYLSKQVRNSKKTAIFAVADSSSSVPEKAIYTIYRPNIGLQVKRENFRELNDKFERVEPDNAKGPWEDQYTFAKDKCQHSYWSGRRCQVEITSKHCDFGLRTRNYHVLSGSVLLVWAIIEDVFHLMAHGHAQPKMQIVRVKINDDDRIVGVLIPNYCAPLLRTKLAEGAVSSNSQGMGRSAVGGKGNDSPDEDDDFQEVQ